MTAGACQKPTGDRALGAAGRGDEKRSSFGRSSLAGGSAGRIMLHCVRCATEKQTGSEQLWLVYSFQSFVPEFFTELVSACEKKVIQRHVVWSRHLFRIADKVVSELP